MVSSRTASEVGLAKPESRSIRPPTKSEKEDKDSGHSRLERRRWLTQLLQALQKVRLHRSYRRRNAALEPPRRHARRQMRATPEERQLRRTPASWLPNLPP